MTAKTLTAWQNADTKNRTAVTNADPIEPARWSNADTKNPAAVVPDAIVPAGWMQGEAVIIGDLPLFSNDGRTLMSNDGRTLETSPSMPEASDLAAWS